MPVGWYASKLHRLYDFISAAEHAFVWHGIAMPTAKALPIKPEICELGRGSRKKIVTFGSKSQIWAMLLSIRVWLLIKIWNFGQKKLVFQCRVPVFISLINYLTDLLDCRTRCRFFWRNESGWSTRRRWQILSIYRNIRGGFRKYQSISPSN